MHRREMPPVAPVPPYVAAFILREIPSERWRSAADGARGTNALLARQLEQALAYLRDGQNWHRSAVDQAISVHGSAEVEIPDEAADSERPPADTNLVAKRLGVSARQVRNLCESGALRATRVGRSWAIDLISVEEYAMRDRDG